MKSWWDSSRRVVKDDYLRVKQKEFRAYKYNMYILNKARTVSDRRQQ